MPWPGRLTLLHGLSRLVLLFALVNVTAVQNRTGRGNFLLVERLVVPQLLLKVSYGHISVPWRFAGRIFFDLL